MPWSFVQNRRVTERVLVQALNLGEAGLSEKQEKIRSADSVSDGVAKANACTLIFASLLAIIPL